MAKPTPEKSVDSNEKHQERVEVPSRVSVWLTSAVTYHKATYQPGQEITVDFDSAVAWFDSNAAIPLVHCFGGLAAISEIRKVQKFIWNDRDGAENFKIREGSRLCKKTIDLFAQLPDEAVLYLPNGMANALRKKTKEIATSLSQIVTEGNEEPFFQQSQSLYERACAGLSVFLAHALTQRKWSNELRSIADSQIGDVIKGIEDRGNSVADQISDHMKAIEISRKEAESTVSEARGIVDVAQNMAAESGVGQNAFYFETEASDHEKLSFKWLWTTIGAAALLFSWLVASLYMRKLSLFDDVNADDYWIVYNLVATKVLVTLLLASLFAYSVKNYLAHKHNQIVNKHRQNALLTYTKLVAASSSPETRDIVLNHAAACIYAPQDSGYVKDSGKTQPAPMPVAIRTTVDG